MSTPDDRDPLMAAVDVSNDPIRDLLARWRGAADPFTQAAANDLEEAIEASEALAIVVLTPSQLMALKDLLLDYVLTGRMREFYDVVRETTTTPADLLALVSRVE